MSRKSDTVKIIADSGSELVTIKRIVRSTSDQQAYPSPRSSTNVSALCSANVLVFQRRVGTDLTKDERGTIKEFSHDVYLPLTSSVTVAMADRIYRQGETDWLEVDGVLTFEDHVEVEATEVKGR